MKTPNKEKNDSIRKIRTIRFPKEISKDAFHGIAGKVVIAIGRFGVACDGLHESGRRGRIVALLVESHAIGVHAARRELATA